MTTHPHRRAAMAYVTLTTGGTVITRRADVAADVLARIGEALDRDGALWSGWSVAVTSEAHEGTRYEMRHGGATLARCWLCATEAASAAWWDEAEAAAPDDVVLMRPRGTPWLATALAIPDPLPPDIAQIMHEMGDATRCVAWALYDRIRSDR